MISKKKICDGCHSEQFIWKNSMGKKYCMGCWSKIKPQPVPKPKKIPTKKVVYKPVKQVSAKRKKEQEIYSKTRIEYLLDNPICMAKIPYICSHDATQVHHKRGRVGLLYLDQNHWISICDNCHKYIELHPKEAKELGLSESRLNRLNI